MKTKRCTKCGEVKPLSEFWRNKRVKNGRTSRCKSCLYAYHRKWSKKNAEHVREYKRQWFQENREFWYQYVNDWKERHPEWVRARRAVEYAIRKGELVRPKRCEQCKATGTPIQAAHYSYEKGRELDVRWLCRSCHAKWDAAEPKTANLRR